LQLDSKEKEINRLQLRIKSLELDKKNSENEVKNANNLNEIYKKKIAELENNMNEIYLG
jgi:chromosome segregation ATPase